jgi:hypothetical protein
MARKVVTADTQMVRRILRHYRAATSDTLAKGAAWYGVAQGAAREIAISLVGTVAWDAMTDADRTELLERVCGVIAALSPRCQWITNVRWAAAMMHAAFSGAECPAVHTENGMRPIAWRIATGEQTPADALRGPKIARFYRNILGDENSVTCDVWACIAAEGASSPSLPANGAKGPAGRRYATVEASYVRAAKIAGVTPATMQAVVWVQVRGRAA